MAPLVRRSWAPCGQTPILRQRTNMHKKVSVIAALCVTPKRRSLQLYFRLHANKSFNTALVKGFLVQLSHKVKRPMVIVWDRLTVHRSKKVQSYFEKQRKLKYFFFPPYAPELNPVEYLWSYLKTNPLANLPIYDEIELAQTARKYSRSIQINKNLLQSFLSHSPLFLSKIGH